MSAKKSIDDFIIENHSTVPESLLPQNVKLKQPFAVCIIGASRGIGEHIAYNFAYAGASDIVLCSRSIKALQEVANHIGEIRSNCKTSIIECDISSPESVGLLAKTIEGGTGRLDAVIVNSGYSGDVIVDITKTPLNSARTAIEVNYLGTFYAAHHLIPLLMQTEGGAKGFVAIGSTAAEIVNGPIANAQYCVSKTAQAKLIEHIHEQYNEQGLLAVDVHPGAVMTQMAKESKGAEVWFPYLTDSPDLCGAFCVWLLKESGREKWLGGRLVKCEWDVSELERKRQEILEGDLLKFHCALG